MDRECVENSLGLKPFNSIPIRKSDIPFFQSQNGLHTNTYADNIFSVRTVLLATICDDKNLTNVTSVFFSTPICDTKLRFQLTASKARSYC